LPERYNRNSRLKGFPNVAEVFGPLTVRGAKAWTSEERKLVAYGVSGVAISAPAFLPLEALCLYLLLVCTPSTKVI
jgi:hypothetical protein